MLGGFNLNTGFPGTDVVCAPSSTSYKDKVNGWCKAKASE